MVLFHSNTVTSDPCSRKPGRKTLTRKVTEIADLETYLGLFINFTKLYLLPTVSLEKYLYEISFSVLTFGALLKVKDSNR